MTHRVLILGSTGQLGRELSRAAWPDDIEPVFLDRQAADFGAPETLGAIVSRQEPDAVVIAAAYTNVDKAEVEEELAMRINAEAPAAIARAAAERSIPMVYVSTDYVFDGTKTTPYEEADPVNPLNAYGRTKLAGEEAVRAANPRHLILRTSWVYSAHGANFLLSMLRLAKEHAEVTIVADQHGCPTAAGDLADAIVRTMPRLLRDEARWGTYHLAGGSETTWHGFAESIFRQLTARGITRPSNKAITTSEFPRPAQRPANGRLSSAAFLAEFGIALPGFETAVPRVLDEALAGTG
jgi:dTDP-4-dehydrorhamnose reductase